MSRLKRLKDANNTSDILEAIASPYLRMVTTEHLKWTVAVSNVVRPHAVSLIHTLLESIKEPARSLIDPKHFYYGRCSPTYKDVPIEIDWVNTFTPEECRLVVLFTKLKLDSLLPPLELPAKDPVLAEVNEKVAWIRNTSDVGTFHHYINHFNLAYANERDVLCTLWPELRCYLVDLGEWRTKMYSKTKERKRIPKHLDFRPPQHLQDALADAHRELKRSRGTPV